ncbi:MAG: DUF3846 domain-containing protein [Oscillospiraceae bacterium]|nr:DUF3846 domain-containing protein [Oscillospiraceae bacterium]
MKVIRKAPGVMPEVIDMENELAALQAEVGGNIDAFTLSKDLAVVFDDEWRLKDKQPTAVVSGMGVDFGGTILIVGVDGEQFCDTPRLDEILWNFFGVVRYGRADRKHNVFCCRRCGHLERFEADGPYENGWNWCPTCRGLILRPVSDGGA